ncbi:hypothetical protein MXB_3256, partial [Myxobolus squamalis]
GEVPVNIETIICCIKTFYKNEFPKIHQEIVLLNKLNEDQIIKSKTIFINFKTLLLSDANELLLILDQRPDVTLRALGLIFHENLESLNSLLFDSIPTPPKFIVRLLNYPVFTPINCLKSQYIGRFVYTKGIVSVIERVKIIPTRMLFECKKCSAAHRPFFFSFESFMLLSNICVRAHRLHLTLIFMIIHEHSLDDENKREKSPGSILCLLKGNLVDSCCAGDEVLVCGTIKGHDNKDGILHCLLSQNLYQTLKYSSRCFLRLFGNH